jgi:hypothetical protein
MMGDNSFGKFMFVVGIVVLALLGLFYGSGYKLAWLGTFVALGLLSWRWSTALFWFFLGNTIVSMLWALRLGAINDQSVLIYVLALTSAAGFVSSAAHLGVEEKKGKVISAKKEEVKVEKKEAPKKVVKKTSKKSTKKKVAKKKSARKKTSKKK